MEILTIFLNFSLYFCTKIELFIIFMMNGKLHFSLESPHTGWKFPFIFNLFYFDGFLKYCFYRAIQPSNPNIHFVRLTINVSDIYILHLISTETRQHVVVVQSWIQSIVNTDEKQDQKVIQLRKIGLMTSWMVLKSMTDSLSDYGLLFLELLTKLIITL